MANFSEDRLLSRHPVSVQVSQRWRGASDMCVLDRGPSSCIMFQFVLCFDIGICEERDLVKTCRPCLFGHPRRSCCLKAVMGVVWEKGAAASGRDDFHNVYISGDALGNCSAVLPRFSYFLCVGLWKSSMFSRSGVCERESGEPDQLSDCPQRLLNAAGGGLLGPLQSPIVQIYSKIQDRFVEQWAGWIMLVSGNHPGHDGRAGRFCFSVAAQGAGIVGYLLAMPPLSEPQVQDLNSLLPRRARGRSEVMLRWKELKVRKAMAAPAATRRMTREKRGRRDELLKERRMRLRRMPWFLLGLCHARRDSTSDAPLSPKGFLQGSLMLIQGPQVGQAQRDSSS